jgi:hypothetical protein
LDYWQCVALNRRGDVELKKDIRHNNEGQALRPMALMETETQTGNSSECMFPVRAVERCSSLSNLVEKNSSKTLENKSKII